MLSAGAITTHTAYISSRRLISHDFGADFMRYFARIYFRPALIRACVEARLHSRTCNVPPLQVLTSSHKITFSAASGRRMPVGDSYFSPAISSASDARLRQQRFTRRRRSASAMPPCRGVAGRQRPRHYIKRGGAATPIDDAVSAPFSSARHVMAPPPSPDDDRRFLLKDRFICRARRAAARFILTRMMRGRRARIGLSARILTTSSKMPAAFRRAIL